jgi:hypothetical protein
MSRLDGPKQPSQSVDKTSLTDPGSVEPVLPQGAMKESSDSDKWTTISPTTPISNSASRMPEPLQSENSGERLHDDTPSTPLSQRRSKAEEKLKVAAAKLEEVIGKEHIKFAVPHAIALQWADDVDDVEGTSQKIQSAIDELIDNQTALTPSKRGLKDCIERWFRVSFPFVKVGLKIVGVSKPSRIIQLT